MSIIIKGNGGWLNPIRLEGAASAITFVDESLIYVGTSGGRIYRVTKNSTGWVAERIDSVPLPQMREIMDIASVPGDSSQ